MPKCGCARNGGLTVKSCNCVKAVKCSLAIMKKRTQCNFLPVIVIPAPLGFLLIYFSVGDFQTPKKRTRCRLTVYSRPHLKHNNTWLIIVMYGNITCWCLLTNGGESLLAYLSYDSQCGESLSTSALQFLVIYIIS